MVEPVISYITLAFGCNLLLSLASYVSLLDGQRAIINNQREIIKRIERDRIKL